MNSISVRFAPSPTGYLHVGNVRTALVNWLFAKSMGGSFMLRMDDTDIERSRPEFAQAIEEDLRWLGLTWDNFARQSERMANYESARIALLAAKRLYPCYETEEELDIRRKLQASRGFPPIYDRASLTLTDTQKADYEAQGRKPHYRFLLEDKPIIWNDMIRGEVKFRGSHVSDPVLFRADGVPLYTIASVVDDAEMHITHIIRGEDHVSNTAVQVQIFEALGYTPPTFGHLALLRTKEGELSKRLGGNDIRGLRDAGFEAMALNSLLARIGTSDPVEPFISLQALADAFAISHFGRATANYDAQDVERLNEKLIHMLPFSAVNERLPFANEAFWLSVRDNIKKLQEAREWWDIIHGEITVSVNDKHYLETALSLLPEAPWDQTTWGSWTKHIATSTARKGKELFLPLRQALTGHDHGPEMQKLLPLMGNQKVCDRLKACIA